MTAPASRDGDGTSVDDGQPTERSYAASDELPPEVESLLELLAAVNLRIAGERRDRKADLRFVS